MATTLGAASTRAWIGIGTGDATVAATVLQQQARIIGLPKGKLSDSSAVAAGVSQLRLVGAAQSRVCVAQRTEPELYDGIANFYDESSGVWEDIWGEHMHHGYYDDEVAVAPAEDGPDHRRAQIRMIEKSLAYAGVPGTSPHPHQFFNPASPSTIFSVFT